MGTGDLSGLDELAAAISRARLFEFVDLYLERRAEVCWRLVGGQVVAREGFLREGAAVRREGVFYSTDGLDRTVLALLLGVSARGLPGFSPPQYAPVPALDEVVASLPGSCTALRWRWSWGAVVTPTVSRVVLRPALAEVTFADGRRGLRVWPPTEVTPEDEETAPPGRLRPGRCCVLLAPAASAVLIHELFGHPLEADLLLDGASPWSGQQGKRLTRLSLDVTDDPTRTDLPGAFSADDEGEAAAPRPLLAAGVLVGALADRATGAALGVAAGNARRAEVHAPPRPRVSNLVASVADPLSSPPRHEAVAEVVSFANGTVEPASGTVHLAVRRAFALRRGERQRLLRPFTLVGALPALRRGLLAGALPAASSAEPGWCGKEGEVVATGAYAPWLLVDGLEVR
ncbi:MAG: metallopeptidase TldD-related protein [Thermoanaerobaculales bacterium]